MASSRGEKSPVARAATGSGFDRQSNRRSPAGRSPAGRLSRRRGRLLFRSWRRPAAPELGLRRGLGGGLVRLRRLGGRLPIPGVLDGWSCRRRYRGSPGGLGTAQQRGEQHQSHSESSHHRGPCQVRVRSLEAQAPCHGSPIVNRLSQRQIRGGRRNPARPGVRPGGQSDLALTLICRPHTLRRL